MSKKIIKKSIVGKKNDSQEVVITFTYGMLQPSFVNQTLVHQWLERKARSLLTEFKMEFPGI